MGACCQFLSDLYVLWTFLAHYLHVVFLRPPRWFHRHYSISSRKWNLMLLPPYYSTSVCSHNCYGDTSAWWTNVLFRAYQWARNNESVRRKQRRSNAEWSCISFAYNVISTQRSWKSAGFLLWRNNECKLGTVTLRIKTKIIRAFCYCNLLCSFN